MKFSVSDKLINHTLVLKLCHISHCTVPCRTVLHRSQPVVYCPGVPAEQPDVDGHALWRGHGRHAGRPGRPGRRHVILSWRAARDQARLWRHDDGRRHDARLWPPGVAEQPDLLAGRANGGLWVIVIIIVIIVISILLLFIVVIIIIIIIIITSSSSSLLLLLLVVVVVVVVVLYY